MNNLLKNLSIVGLVAVLAGCTTQPATEARLDEVAEKGRHVMPFSLEKTTHVFTKTPQGGIQKVVAKDKTDTGQIKLIRAHLSKITQQFKQGDFSGPMSIHGADMPGLAVMRQAKAGELAISYKDLPNGGEIDYSSQKPEMIAAIHRYFDAQLSDHARHAVAGHSMQHQMHTGDMHSHHAMHQMSTASAQSPGTDVLDKRLLVKFTEKQRLYFLGDMRTLLAGTQAIITGLAANDRQAVVKAARSIGMGMTHNPKGDFHSAIPPQMMKLGMGMHQLFDEVANDVEAGKDSRQVLQRVSDAMSQCLACHATYQIHVND